ncbi:TPA: transcriptional regulator MelR [Aeromonas bestiarum]|uniref:transcriptional regulator MelR n=1 Tax=Aeromonas sp. CA23 TaxID=2033032 RepID=UPI000BFC8C1C|nr:transcriptional regulator MelR [Aeromonas sp. CA23]ATL97557.1 transcriptional regulator MelR [Aeromonas sp. CA23]HEH9404885.1 transcriptional regulator MelR [Aeromonas bestiarum]
MQPERPYFSSVRDTGSTDAGLSSPLSLYSAYDALDVELRAPHEMAGYHWHGQVEVNIPFDGEVEYTMNGQSFTLTAGHAGLFWATIPHQLTRVGNCTRMGLINVPVHLFLSWPINRDLLTQVTHGGVLQSRSPMLVSEFELARWVAESRMNEPGRQQLVTDEICLMLRRIGLDGWTRLLASHHGLRTANGSSRHAQFHVQQMLEYIAEHHDAPLTTQELAEHVGLHPNYAMGLFQKVMKMSVKQYVTAMRINHARALLSDTERNILDIALTVGFNSSSRFYETFQRYLGLTPNHYRQLSRGRASSTNT